MNQGRHHTIAVVGNPNCGKTTLFNALTGAKQRVGNWPGVTVERKTGNYRHDGARYEVVDLPGTYSLDVGDPGVSLDEQIARDYVHGGEADLIINIVDAANLERNLYLTTQLIEMRKPMLVVLNMTDVAADQGLTIDAAVISVRLGCPVVPLVATEAGGMNNLRHALAEAVAAPPIPAANIVFDDRFEQAVAELSPLVRDRARTLGVELRWLATRLLEEDDLAQRLAGDLVAEDRLAAWRTGLTDDVDILLADGRYDFAHRLVQESVRRPARVSRNLTERIDRVVLNRVLGIPIFLLVMYAMLMLTINIGGAFIDFFDQLASALLVTGFGGLLAGLGAPDWLRAILADGIGGGIQVVATFIPIITFLYLFLSVLEDSGYMARAAFVMDRFMRAVGLPGKAFVPLIVGFGCNVPAIMATRTLESRRDRILTILMAPFMSCGARLPVYALFAAAFFPTGGQNVVFGLYLIGIAIAVITGFIMKQTLLQGQSSPFVMELPPYHLPTLHGVAMRSWERTKNFMFRAGRIIVPMVLVLNLLNTVGSDGSFGNEDSGNSVLAAVGRTIAPAFAPMGLDEENWPAAVGFFTGLLAKEAIIGTLDTMYSAMAEVEPAAKDQTAATFGLWREIKVAFATVPANLAKALAAWRDPLGVNIQTAGDPAVAAAGRDTATGAFAAMAARFDGAAGAFAYLLFILLYAPCTAALAAVYRETGLAWTGFVALWTTGLAYMVSTGFYQAAIFSRHPESSTLWIAGLLAAFWAAIIGLKRFARHEQRRTLATADGV